MTESHTRSLKGRTLFISGGTRGIGLAIAIRAARDGANIAILGKTKEAHPKLEGTVHTAAREVEKAGGQAIAVVCDIQEEAQVASAVEATVAAFGGIDILVNNASAIFLADTDNTPMKRYDLMNQVNARGTFLCGKLCLPYLRKSAHGRILSMSPPLDLRPEYFGPHLAYSIAKFGMSLCTLGWAEEFKKDKIGVNSLWPRTIIDTAAVRNLLGGSKMAEKGRSVDIVADAAYEILTRPASYTGNFAIDEEVLREAGISDFENYAVCKGNELMTDLFLPKDT